MPTRKTTKKRGRPSQAQTLDADFKFRLSADDRDLFERAAASVARRRGAGSLALSAWIRETCVQAARDELGEV